MNGIHTLKICPAYHLDYRKTCFQIHKWLSLLFSLPFVLLALSGFIISLKPEPQPLNIKSPVPIIDVLLKLQSKRSHWSFPRVNFNRDYFTFYGLHSENLKLLTIERRNGSLVSEEDPSENIFFSFQTLHESFYFETFGKRLVGLSGLGLAQASYADSSSLIYMMAVFLGCLELLIIILLVFLFYF